MHSLKAGAPWVAIVLCVGCAGGPAVKGNAISNVERVTVENTAPEFLGALRKAHNADGVFEQWEQYEAAHRDLLVAAKAMPQDLVEDKNLRKLAVSADAVTSLVEAFDRAAPGDLKEVLTDLETHAGYEVPVMTVAFAVCRSPDAAWVGELGVHPLLLLNARSLELVSGAQRRLAFAQQIFRIAHKWQQSDSTSLGPLANAVYRTGAALLVSRIVVPTAFEPQLLQLSEDQLTKLRARESLIAQELLAALDSSGDTDLQRFFDPHLKDPLLPRGSGPFIADRLFQRIAAEQGSTSKPLRLSPTEFLQQARRQLATMATHKSGNL